MWPVYAVLLLNGVVRAFNGPASQAFLPLVVPEEVFPNAVAWGSSVFQGSQILGPMVGGLVYGITGSPAPCMRARWSAASRGAMVLMGALQRERAARGPVPRGVIEGLRYLWRTKIVLGAISLDMFAVLLGGAVALLPVYAKDILHVGATGLGILRGAPGAGAVIMALVLAHRPLGRRAGAHHAVVRRGFRRVHGGVRALAQCGAQRDCADAGGRVRHGQRDCAAYAGAAGDAGRDARTRERRELGVHRRVERSGTVRIGGDGGVAGGGPAVVLGGIGTIVVVALWASLFPELRRVRTVATKIHRVTST